MKISDLDINWSAKRAHEIVVRQFPQFAQARRPKILGRGWDNVCVIYKDGTVFRLPTRKMGGEIMAVERAVLPKIAPRLSLPVPDFQYFGEPDALYAWPYVGYPFLVGTTAEQFWWTDEERMRAAPVLGKFLNGLHQIPISDELASVLPGDLIQRADKDALLKRTANYAPQIIVKHPSRAKWARKFQDLAISLAEGVELEPRSCIVHGDLYPRHILANEARDVVGVIDWGDVHFGHPFLDLSIAYTFFDLAEREAFFSAYGLPVTPAMKALAQIKAINYMLVLYLYGRHAEAPNVLEMVKQIEARFASGDVI